jgi:transposase
MDEHRLGLQALLGRVYAKRGQRPVVALNRRYEWLYLFGFVCPESGQTYWLLMPGVSIIVFNLVLAELAKALGLGENKRIILVLDGAGWHSSEQVVVPAGIDLIFLPPYSPELQPAERLWPLTNEGIVNRDFANLEELEKVQAEWCLKVSERREEVRALTCYKWWPLLRA